MGNLWWDYSVVNGGLNNGNLLLGGYTLGVQSEAYIGLTDDEILDKLAGDLVDKFPTKPWIPSRLVQGVVENWSKNPFFKGTLLIGDTPARVIGGALEFPTV